MKFLETHKLWITPLSPIHIGCAEDYDPTNYVIRDDHLFGFDPTRLELTEKERSELLAITDRRGDEAVLGLQAFFAHMGRRAQAVATHHVAIAPRVAELYRDRIGQAAQREQGGRRVVNNLQIARTAFNPHLHQPILPGSSIKGSIRTAILNEANDGPRKAVDARDAKRFEIELLGGSFSSDPMRLVKLADATAETAERRILFQVNRRKTDGEARQQLALLMEVVAPMQAACFMTEIAISANPSGLQGFRGDPQKVPEWTLTWAEIIEACNRFYLQELRRELGHRPILYAIDEPWLAALESIAGHTALKQGRACLLRLGRHSGAESVTIDGVRAIKIMAGRGNQPIVLDHALTVWLAAESDRGESRLLPFGWALVEVDEPVPELRALIAGLQARYSPKPSVALAPRVAPVAAAPVAQSPSPEVEARQAVERAAAEALAREEAIRKALNTFQAAIGKAKPNELPQVVNAQFGSLGPAQAAAAEWFIAEFCGGLEQARARYGGKDWFKLKIWPAYRNNPKKT